MKRKQSCWGYSHLVTFFNFFFFFEPALDIKRFIASLQKKKEKKRNCPNTICISRTLVFVFVSHVPCKISSVLRVIAHSHESVVSLSAWESFQGAEEFTQTLELWLGAGGNCKDKVPAAASARLPFHKSFRHLSDLPQISSWRPPALIRILVDPRGHFRATDGDLQLLSDCVSRCQVMPPFGTSLKYYVTDPCFILSLSLSCSSLILLPPV